MNTWRDIKTDPPQINWPVNPVFVTDGKNVYFGRLMWDPDVLFFEGCSLQKGDSVFVPASELTEWQPIPDTWKPEKSADEMFRELEYMQVRNDDEAIIYALGNTDIPHLTIEANKKGEIIFPTVENDVVFLTFKETLACAQLIQEMQNGSD